jgi:[acyl-carrier-protein] S-malonyltransferase
MPTPEQLRAHLSTVAFAFRGYDVTNLGRTPELLAHPAYGPVMEAALRRGSEISSDALRRPLDLVARVRECRETKDLATYAEDVALIVVVELAQLQLLEQFFGIALSPRPESRGGRNSPTGGAKLAFGYSLGEASAVIATGVYAMEHLLPVPLSLADDCVALAEDVTMGILFSRGPILAYSLVERLCVEISQEGKGVIAISTYLSPNSFLLLGKGDTVDRFKARMHRELDGRDEPAHPLEGGRLKESRSPVHLRKNPHRWPPLHTPFMWQRCVANRSAVQLQTLPGGLRAPTPPVLSGVTGKASYNDYNSRQLLNQWVDHPQRLWDVVYTTLAAGVQTIVHVGPNPNIIPATFKRLSDNVKAEQVGYSLRSLGRRAVSQMVRRPWLRRLLAARTALLRAPDVEQIILEDWLLDQKVP